MAPYVAAVSNIEWNSPNCGKCYQIVGWAKTIYVTAIDQCGAGPSGETHFDIHPDGYRELMGDAGVTAGSGYVTYKEVASSYCKGNKGWSSSSLTVWAGTSQKTGQDTRFLLLSLEEK
jgi:hypothetical protein